MKRFNWLLIGVIVLSLAVLPLAGCVSKAEYEALQVEQATLVDKNNSLKAELQKVQADLSSAKADLSSVQADLKSAQADLANAQSKYDKLNADYEATKKELAEIKELYPPRDFSSLKELQDWLVANDVSERPAATTAEGLYSKALEIQEDALRDGYIVSVDLDAGEEAGVWYIACVTIINGDIWAWGPETDEPINVSPMLDFQKVK